MHRSRVLFSTGAFWFGLTVNSTIWWVKQAFMAFPKNLTTEYTIVSRVKCFENPTID